MREVIDRVALTHLQLPLKDMSGGQEAHAPGLRDTILVALTTSEGRTGVGECAPPLDESLPRALAQCWKELSTFLPEQVLGWGVTSTDEFEGMLPRAGKLHHSSRTAIESAVWDLIGQRRNLSLAHLLGATDARIEAGIAPSLRLASRPTVVDLLRSIEPHLDEGIRTFTVPIAPGSDLEFLTPLRSHFPDCQFAADARGRYNRSHATLFKRMDELDLLWIDDPLPPEDFEGMATLQADLFTPLSVDASHCTVIKHGGARLARLELQRVGGLSAARQAHDLCLAHHVGCRVCTGPESDVGLAQALALATLPNCKEPSGLAPAAAWFADVFAKPPIEVESPQSGRFRVSTRPGLGHVVDWIRIREHQVQSQEFHHRSQGTRLA